MTTRKFNDTDLQKPLTKAEGPRVRITDKGYKGVKGLTCSITASGAVFSLRFWDKVQNKQRGPFKIGVFHPTMLNVEEARKQAYKLKGEVEENVDIIARASGALMQKRAEGLCFNDVADLYIDWLRVPVKKKHGIAARRESWDRLGGPEVEGATPKYQGGYLKRARAAFGNRAIADIIDDDIAMLLNGITDQGLPGLTVNLRTTLFGLFRWAGQPGRKYVRANPCSNLGDRPEMIARERALTDEEIAKLWGALDADDCPVPRSVALALKLMLCTGLRGGEVCAIQREWLGVIDGMPVVRIPAPFTKQRRPNHHPLNGLAVEVVNELLAMSDATTGPLFPAGRLGAVFRRHMLTDYLGDGGRGWGDRKPKGGATRERGLRGYLGFTEDWRPHDLRHTVATLLVRNGGDMASVTKVLDHAPGKEAGVAKISERYTNLKADESAKLKRPVVEAIDRLLRGIISPPAIPQGEPKRLAA